MDKREWRQVTNIAGSGPYTLTLNSALAIAHAAGAVVTSYEAAAPTISTWRSQTLARGRAVGMGDSNTHGHNQLGLSGTPDASGTYYVWYDPRVTAWFRACRELNMDYINLGIQGTDTANQASRAAQFTTYGIANVDYIFIWEGVNDINGSTITPTAYKANIQTQITTALTVLKPTTGRILLVPPYKPAGPNAQGLTPAVCRTKLAELASENAQTVYVDDIFDDIVDARDVNGIHFTIEGHTLLKANILPYLGASPFIGFGLPI
jgi:lysophospholipase L1-like esterase